MSDEETLASELSYDEFKEQALRDPTFAGKLKMLESPLEPKNLKDRSKLVSDHMNDTTEQFRADTLSFNRMVEEFELKWNGKKGEYGKQVGGLSETSKDVFSWMRQAFEAMCQQRCRELTRATQTMALQEAEANAAYDELARVYGDPKAAITSMVKLIDEQHALITKLSAKDAEIQGQIKLGKEKEK